MLSFSLDDSDCPNPLLHHARTRPDDLAIVLADRTVTWNQLAMDVVRAIRNLKRNHLKVGDRLMLSAGPSYDYLVALLAAFNAGITACPVNPKLPSVAFSRAMKLVDPGMVLTRSQLGSIHDPNPSGVRAQPCLDELPDRWELKEEATVVFTSGSAAKPKAALHLLQNHVTSAWGANQAMPFVPGDRWLLSLPLYHVGGLAILFRCIMSGATLVLPDEAGLSISRPRQDLAQLIRQEHLSHLSLVPTQLFRLLQCRHLKSAVRSLKVVLVGGAPTSIEMLRQAQEAGIPVYPTYGCTEASSQIATARPPLGERDKLPQMKILPGREVTLAENGEIFVRGPVVFAGYLQPDRLVKDMRDSDGWYHTGDLGRLSSKGLLSIAGRVDHMFISGGENIQPAEIEQAICQLPGITDAVVVPVHDDEWGERPFAFVSIAPERQSLLDADIPDESWFNAVLTHVLPRYKMPVGYAPLPELENGHLKPSRHQLIELAGTYYQS